MKREKQISDTCTKICELLHQILKEFTHHNRTIDGTILYLHSLHSQANVEMTFHQSVYEFVYHQQQQFCEYNSN